MNIKTIGDKINAARSSAEQVKMQSQAAALSASQAADRECQALERWASIQEDLETQLGEFAKFEKKMATYLTPETEAAKIRDLASAILFNGEIAFSNNPTLAVFHIVCQRRSEILAAARDVSIGGSERAIAAFKAEFPDVVKKYDLK